MTVPQVSKGHVLIAVSEYWLCLVGRQTVNEIQVRMQA